MVWIGEIYIFSWSLKLGDWKRNVTSREIDINFLQKVYQSIKVELKTYVYERFGNSSDIDFSEEREKYTLYLQENILMKKTQWKKLPELFTKENHRLLNG